MDDCFDDFYLDKKDLAPYFEAQWWDKFVQQEVAPSTHSRVAAIPSDFIQTHFFTQSAQWICRNLQRAGATPRLMLEIGPALGRTCYELIGCRFI